MKEKEFLSLSQGYKIRDQRGLYFVTFQVVHWIDIFSRQVYRDILMDSFRYAIKNKGLKVHAYVIMTNHVHAILSSVGEDLSDIIGAFKSHTCKKIVDIIPNERESRRSWLLNLFSFAGKISSRNKTFKLWTNDNHPIFLDTNFLMEQKLNYIHQNPVRAGLVYKPEDWIYSSASAYAGMDSLIEIEFIC